MRQQILSRAADLIEQHGWCQNAYSTPDGKMCTSRAINQAAEELGVFRDARSYLTPEARDARQHFQTVVGADVIATWNDKKCGSLKQAVEALRKAAE